jgi:hypothetical protein
MFELPGELLSLVVIPLDYVDTCALAVSCKSARSLCSTIWPSKLEARIGQRVDVDEKTVFKYLCNSGAAVVNTEYCQQLDRDDVVQIFAMRDRMAYSRIWVAMITSRAECIVYMEEPCFEGRRTHRLVVPLAVSSLLACDQDRTLVGVLLLTGDIELKVFNACFSIVFDTRFTPQGKPMYLSSLSMGGVEGRRNYYITYLTVDGAVVTACIDSGISFRVELRDVAYIFSTALDTCYVLRSGDLLHEQFMGTYVIRARGAAVKQFLAMDATTVVLSDAEVHNVDIRLSTYRVASITSMSRDCIAALLHDGTLLEIDVDTKQERRIDRDVIYVNTHRESSILSYVRR